MRKEVWEGLAEINDEERAIQAGQNAVAKNLYTDEEEFVIDSAKMLAQGKLIAIRRHTRFAHFPCHRHNYIEMVYMCAGETTHIINGHTITLREGELLCMNRHAAQEVLPAGLDDIAVNFIIIPRFFDVAFAMMPERNFLKDFLVDAVTESKTGFLHFKVADVIPIQNLVENLIWSIQNKQSNAHFINQTTMGLLFMQILNHTGRAAGADAPYEDGVMFQILHYIDETYKTAGLAELAVLLGKEPSWVSRFIKRQTGQSFTELLQYKRLNQAVFRLKTSRMGVGEIIYEVGYENAGHFHRIFKAAFGMTPRQMRAGEVLL